MGLLLCHAEREHEIPPTAAPVVAGQLQAPPSAPGDKQLSEKELREKNKLRAQARSAELVALGAITFTKPPQW